MCSNQTRFSVIIPTCNRSNSISDTLLSILSQNMKPVVIYVIDQSDDRRTEQVCMNYILVHYIHSDIKSLTHARNIGISESIKINASFWVFLDDDVILYPNYFNAIANTYLCHSDVIAIAGWVELPWRRERHSVFWKNIFKRFFALDGFASDANLMPHFFANSLYRCPASNTLVGWMSGCSMSARNIDNNNVYFDENLILYALAEDRDYSYRLSLKGKIVLVPNAKLLHKQIPTGRIPSRKTIFMHFIHHYYLMHKNHRRSKFAHVICWWTFSIQYIISLLISAYGIITNKKSYISMGKDYRDAFSYLIQNVDNIKKLDLTKFHTFLIND